MSTKKQLYINEKGLIVDTNKKLAIIGTASSSVNEAPYDDMSWTCMTLGWRLDSRRSNIKIDVHRFDAERINVPKDYFGWLNNANVPVYLQGVHPDVKNSHRIPIELLVHTFGDYFASSIGYAIAIGILSGYEDIGLWGIDLLDNTEYSFQRPNAEWLLGNAAGRGIRIHVPNSSALLKFNHRYGYDRSPDAGTLSKDFLHGKLKKYMNMHEEHSKHAIAADGAKQAIEDILNSIETSNKGKLIND